MNDPTEIEFGIEPPAPKPRVTNITLICDALRSRPGEWALIRKDTGKKKCESYAGNLKGGIHAANVKGEFDAKVAELPAEMQPEPTEENPEPEIVYGVWAKYLGVPVPEEAPQDNA